VDSIETHTFGTINTVPVAMPGNPNVYAQPQPSNFSG
jgi:hypothetical protein